MTPGSVYREKRHGAESLAGCQERLFPPTRMNPEIYRQFFRMVTAHGGQIVWEPFSLPMGCGVEHAEDAGVTLIAHSLESRHKEVFVADSTERGPYLTPVDGVIFHPPYFGSSPQSQDDRDLSHIDDEDRWLVAMESAAEIALENLVDGGFVCAVGSRYRCNGSEVKLDEWLFLAFHTLELLEVWKSEPDVAMVLRAEQ